MIIDSSSSSNNRVSTPSALPFRDDGIRRSATCEFCGILFKHDETTLKLCNGHIRSVCFICQHEIADYEAGIDITSTDYNVSPRPGEMR